MRWAAMLIALAACPAAAAEYKVTEAECARVVRYAPSADVAYVPGRDVDGEPVAPADLGGGARVVLPREIPIPITIKLGRRFGIPATRGAYHAEAYIGIATIDTEDGRVTFNGETLSNEDEAALIAACREALAKERRARHRPLQ